MNKSFGVAQIASVQFAGGMMEHPPDGQIRRTDPITSQHKMKEDAVIGSEYHRLIQLSIIDN